MRQCTIAYNMHKQFDDTMATKNMAIKHCYIDIVSCDKKIKKNTHTHPL